jgi:hypothetical protein
VRSLWGEQHLDWCQLKSRGTSGGIVLSWDRRVVEKIDDFVGDYTMAGKLRSVS